MTRKQRRGILIGICMAVLAVAVGLMLFAFRGSIMFFYSPTEVAQKHIAPGQRFRLGGLVAMGSIKHGNGTTVRFEVTDKRHELPVTYTGILPDLFRQGQGVVVEGSLGPGGVFHADTVLAKHDEKYMPPEVAAELKKKGLWQGGSGTAEANAGAAKPKAAQTQKVN